MPTAIITGANRGIGLEFARQYVGDGWDVIATAREPGDADELNSLGVRVQQLDMRDLQRVVAFGEAMDGQVDLLIANADTSSPLNSDTAEDGREWTDML